MLSDEYIAGFFDGEGSVSITATLSPHVAIAQKRPEVLSLIRNKYGFGEISKKTRVAEIYIWVVCGKEKVAKFLMSIYPYLIVKKQEVDIVLKLTSLIRSDNRGCNPLSLEDRRQREELRSQLQELRPSSNFLNLSAEEHRHRQMIKEKSNFKCSRCSVDLRETTIRNQLIVEDELLCRKCHSSKIASYDRKPLNAKQIIQAIESSDDLEMASKKLDITRSSLFHKRMKMGLVRKFCSYCQKEFTPNASLLNYCSDECAEKGKIEKLKLRQEQYLKDGRKSKNDKKYRQGVRRAGILLKKKEWQEKNKERLREYRKEYYLKRKALKQK